MTIEELLKQATTRPWSLTEVCCVKYIQANGATILGVKLPTSAHARHYDANAELIVRAVNSYEAMRAALERWARYCEQHSDPAVQGIACDTFAALALAEGE